MLKEQINILIVDDDKTLGKAFSEAISREGYQAVLVHTPEDALSAVKMRSFHVMIIDCMLPKTPGVDLSLQLRQNLPDAKLILVSGIYRDKSFIREAVQKTKAFRFLTKPCNVTDLLGSIQESLDGLIEEPKAPIPQLFSNQHAKPREILEAIEESDVVHGFELPFIYSLFLNRKLSGHMNIIEEEGNIYGITFSKGKIIAVDSNDSPTQLGDLLVEKGFITKGEIEDEMKEENSDMKIGERLVAANLLSPHALDEVLLEQLEVRLGNTVFEASVEINFMKSDAPRDVLGIELSDYVFLLNRWFENKVSSSWLQNYYVPWLDHGIEKGPSFDERHSLFATPLFYKNPNFAQDLLTAGSLHNLLATNKYDEKELYQCLHLLAITRCLGFDSVAGENNADYETIHSRLNKIYKDIKNKNHFEILNLSLNAKGSEIKKAYHELAKALHPDKLGADAPQETIELNDKLFTLVTSAHNVLKDEENRKNYLQELKEGQAKKLLFAESLIDSGKNLLKTGQLQQALDKFNEAFEIQKDNTDLILYRNWARLKSIKPDIAFQELKNIEKDFSEIPSDQRHTALYQFVKGLYQKEKGNLDAAKNHIEQAISIEPRFIEARRELNVIQLKEKNKPVDILRGDLKDVVGMLFKRK